jgi:hypothetical protein
LTDGANVTTSKYDWRDVGIFCSRSLREYDNVGRAQPCGSGVEPQAPVRALAEQ